MALRQPDRIYETATVTGTGAVTLQASGAGAVHGFNSFASAMANADTAYVCFADTVAGVWEVSLCTFTFGTNPTLARGAVTDSSSGASAIAFAGNTTQIFIVVPGVDILTTLAAAGIYAPLASPTFTGAVTVPTATTANEATNFAQVQSMIGGYSGVYFFGSSQTLTLAQANGIIQVIGSGVVLTLPTSLPSGTTYTFYSGISGNFTINPPTGGFIYSPPQFGTSYTSLIVEAGDTVVLMGRGVSEYDIVGGNIVAWIGANPRFYSPVNVMDGINVNGAGINVNGPTNNIVISGSSASTAVSLQATGTDTNIDFSIAPKNGVVSFNAPSYPTTLNTRTQFVSVGLSVGWNFTNSVGETDFFVGPGGGAGGAYWYQLNSSGQLPVLIMKLDHLGNMTVSGNVEASGTANNVTMAGNSTGNPVSLTASGTDANIGINLTTKGTGGVAVSGGVGFNGTAPVGKYTLTGAKMSNPALASVIAALVALGLVVDTTTA